MGQAITLLSREKVLNMLPKGRCLETLGETLPYDYSWVERMLTLPANAKITGASIHAFFCQDTIGFRIEHPSLQETKECENLPFVDIDYWHGLVTNPHSMLKKCTCRDLGHYDPKCPLVGVPSGGVYHCIKCGAEPRWETAETMATANFETYSEEIKELRTRYCDDHRPLNAIKIAAETWRDRPKQLL